MIEINVFSFLFLLFMFLTLFFRKETSLPNKVLAFVLLIPGLNFVSNVLILNIDTATFPWLYFLVQVTATLFAPLTYYYITLLTGSRHQWKHQWWLIGISSLIALYGMSIAIHFATKPYVWQENYMYGVENGPYPTDMFIYSIIFFLHQLLYFSLNIVEVRRYRNEMTQQVSSLTAVKVAYLQRFVAILWLLTLLTVVLYATIDTTHVEYIFLPIVMVIILFFMVYHAFNQNAVFSSDEYAQHLQKIPLLTPDHSQKKIPAQNCPEIATLLFQIKSTIVENELYRDPEINLQAVATALDRPAYHLTEALHSSDTTFYETVRKIRVEKAKEMLTDKKLNYTIEAVAYEVGFNSRASFYRAFKKYEKTSPSSLIN